MSDALGCAKMGCIEKEFSFTFSDSLGQSHLTAPVSLPLTTSCKEFAYRIATSLNVPCYVEENLINALEKFVKQETNQYYDQQIQKSFESLAKKNEGEIEQLAEKWSRSFNEEHMKYSKPEGISNEAVFSEMYHSIVHSGALEELMNLEHSFSVAMEDLIQERDADLSALEETQAKDIEDTIKRVGYETTDAEVNVLASRHFDNTQLVQSKWASEMSALHTIQKREFVEWIFKTYEDYQTSGSIDPIFSNRDRSVTQSSKATEDEWEPEPGQMEESFTIHLGAQMKQMHNLRLLATEALNFCWRKSARKGSALPHRLQTAMSLYSNNLCAMVLLVDNRINSYVGIKKEFNEVCQHSSEFHFPDLEAQLEATRNEVKFVTDWRNNMHGKIESSNEPDEKDTKDSQPLLKTGDCYVTRHSNLAEVHIVFHLTVDDSLNSSEISSRHPTILALRNILKVACMCDITTLTLPLLLVHEMTEEMTIPWCLKRAELVFKCIKGFMMEMASWGGSESRTVQFLVPKGISEELFGTLTSMLPGIFRISNPLIVKST